MALTPLQKLIAAGAALSAALAAAVVVTHPPSGAFAHCVTAEEVFLQGGQDSLIYVPTLGDTTRARMWADEKISGADQSYADSIQICMSDSMFAKSRKVLTSSYGPPLSWVQLDGTHQMVLQGLPGPSDRVRAMLFGQGESTRVVYGTLGHTFNYADDLQAMLIKPADGIAHPFPAANTHSVQFARSFSIQRMDDPRPDDPAPRYVVNVYNDTTRWFKQFEIPASAVAQIASGLRR